MLSKILIFHCWIVSFNEKCMALNSLEAFLMCISIVIEKGGTVKGQDFKK